MVDHAFIVRSDLGRAVVYLVVAWCPLVAYGAFAAFFPEELPMMASSTLCLAACTVMSHLTIREWPPRINQTPLQTRVRRCVMSVQTLMMVLLSIAHATGPKLRSWTTLRLLVLIPGIFDLVHTLWLHSLYVLSPPLVDRPVNYMTGVQTGPPSYFLGVSLIVLAVIFNVRMRGYVSRITGGAQLAFDLGQLTHSELERLVPDLKPAVARGGSGPSQKSSSTGSARGATPPLVPAGPVDRVAAQARRSRDHSPSVASGPSQASASRFSWSSYGRRWEEEWQERRETELEVEREQQLYDDSRALLDASDGGDAPDEGAWDDGAPEPHAGPRRRSRR